MLSEFSARVVALASIVRRVDGVRLHGFTKTGEPVNQHNRRTVPAGATFEISDPDEFNRLIEAGVAAPVDTLEGAR